MCVGLVLGCFWWRKWILYVGILEFVHGMLKSCFGSELFGLLVLYFGALFLRCNGCDLSRVGGGLHIVRGSGGVLVVGDECFDVVGLIGGLLRLYSIEEAIVSSMNELLPRCRMFGVVFLLPFLYEVSGSVFYVRTMNHEWETRVCGASVVG